MRKLVEQTVIETVSLLEECDICGQDLKDTLENMTEFQEAISVSFMGGYGSVFGDEEFFEIDICQSCFKEKLGKWVRNVTAEKEQRRRNHGRW